MSNRDWDWVNRRENIIHADKASGDLSQYQSRGGADFRKVCEKCGLKNTHALLVTAALMEQKIVKAYALIKKIAVLTSIAYSHLQTVRKVKHVAMEPAHPIRYAV